MRENKDKLNVAGQAPEKEQLSLNDDRRVEVLSPGALVLKRFFRNRLAVIGLTMLIAMFIFSFIGGLISPYRQDEQFYTIEMQSKQYLGVVKNDTLRYTVAPGGEFGSVVQSKLLMAMGKGETSFTYKDITYDIQEEGDDLLAIYTGGELLAFGAKDIINLDDSFTGELSFETRHEALKAYVAGESSFSTEGKSYKLDGDGNILDGDTVVAYISRFVVSPVENGVVLTRAFKEELEDTIDSGAEEFIFTGEDGVEYTYTLHYDPATLNWAVNQDKETYVYDRYASPSKEHWLGTDTNGMDMLTRLMCSTASPPPPC